MRLGQRCSFMGREVRTRLKRPGHLGHTGTEGLYAVVRIGSISGITQDFSERLISPKHTWKVKSRVLPSGSMVPPPTLSQSIGRFAMGSLLRLAPPLGARFAWSQFIKSPTPVTPDEQDVHFLEAHAHAEVLDSAGHKVKVYRVESPGKVSMRVLMMHGWGSRATAMLGIGKQFIRGGAEVVFYDGPGSGLTEAPISMLPHSWQVLEDMQRNFGPFDVVVGHSFAGITAAHVLAAGKIPSCKVFVTIGSPNSLVALTESVLEERGFSLRFMDYFNRKSLELAGKPMSDLGVVAELADVTATQFEYLCLHDDEDKEVLVSHADEIEQALLWAQVERTTGLGHNRILHDATLQARVFEFAKNALQKI
ncbi:MAG: hypothetical protein ACI9X4_001864 [Glaciecola sp.]|jgi:hypothetical protein